MPLHGGRFREWRSKIRYDNDGAGPAGNQTWDSIINAHGTDQIAYICITGGYNQSPVLVSQAVNSYSYEIAARAPHTVTFITHN